MKNSTEGFENVSRLANPIIKSALVVNTLYLFLRKANDNVIILTEG